MKQFAFPLSIKCSNQIEATECLNLLTSIGYNIYYYQRIYTVVATNISGLKDLCSDVASKYDHDRHHIDHFNPKLIRDIAAACTNDTWQAYEPLINVEYNKFTRVQSLVGGNVKDCKGRYERPTLAEICEHHGYEIKGKCIVKKAPLSAKAPILFDLDKCEFVSIDQIVTNGVSLEHHIDVEIKLKKALKEIEDLKHEITAWEVKYENIKQVVNR